MNVYVVYCHPNPHSFTAAVLDRAITALQAASHVVRISDLYADGFDPALSREERLHHRESLEPPRDVATYCDNLKWCDTLMFIYPTWWSGQPAMLTGWLDRVLRRGVAWDLPEGGSRISGQLTNVRRLITITSHGSPKWLNVLEGNCGKRITGRSLRVLCNRFARTTWLGLYNIDRSTPEERDTFLDRVERRLGAL